MKMYALHARLLAPVVIKRERQSERSESTHSISGTTLRGALAAVYLQQHGTADSRFNRLFLDESVCRFGPLDPAAHLFPLTAAACKRHGVKHALVDQLWFHLGQHMAAAALPEAVQTPWRRCARCDTDLKPHSGFWYRYNGKLHEAEADQSQVLAHVGIDRHTLTAAEGILYTLEAVVPSKNEDDLVGWVMLDDDAHDTLQELLDNEDGIVYVGHHRTRGYGRMRLHLAEPIDAGRTDSKFQQWTAWSAALHAFLRTLLPDPDNLTPGGTVPGAGLDPCRDFLFALSFPTGAVLVDRFLRYSADPAEMIPWLPPLPDPDHLFPLQARPHVSSPDSGTLCSLATVTHHELLRGWNAAHGLPRQDEWMVARGAVYAYWFQGTEAQRRALYQRLDELTQIGAGLRRNEGYGRVVINDSFHSSHAHQETSQ